MIALCVDTKEKYALFIGIYKIIFTGAYRIYGDFSNIYMRGEFFI